MCMFCVCACVRVCFSMFNIFIDYKKKVVSFSFKCEGFNRSYMDAVRHRFYSTYTWSTLLRKLWKGLETSK